MVVAKCKRTLVDVVGGSRVQYFEGKVYDIDSEYYLSSLDFFDKISETEPEQPKTEPEPKGKKPQNGDTK